MNWKSLLRRPAAGRAQPGYLYEKWDAKDFSLPAEWQLREESSLGEALRVFYQAGGYDVFKVVEPKLYADNWLEFVGMLYSDIDGGRYARGERHFRFPLSEETRRELTEQGVPELFTSDF